MKNSQKIHKKGSDKLNTSMGTILSVKSNEELSSPTKKSSKHVEKLDKLNDKD